MIHHMQTRRALEEALDLVDPKRKVIRWPMTKFRHALFKVVDECTLIRSCSFSFNIKDQFTYCKLYFKDTSISMSYSHKTDTVLVSKDDSSHIKVCTLEELPSYIHSLQPKVVVKLRRNK